MKMKKRNRLLSVLLSLSLVAGLAAGLGFRAQDAMAMNEKNDNFASAKGDVEIHEAYSSRIDEVNEAGTYYFHMYSRYDDGPDHYVNNAMYTAIRNEDGTLTKKSVSGVTIGPRVNAYVSPDDYTVEGDEENPENVYSLHFMYTIEVSDQCEENCCVIQDYSGVYASKPDGFTWSEDDLGSALNIYMQNEEPSEEIRAWTSEKGDVSVDEATKVNDDSKVEHDVRSGIKTYYVHLFSTEKDISHYQLHFGVWKDGSAKFYSSLEGVTLGDWTKATDSSENNYHYFAEVKIDTKIAESFEFMAVSDEVDASDGKTYMKEGSENYEDPYGGNCWLMMDYYNIGDPLSDGVEAWTSELGDVPKDEAEKINEENKVEEKDKSGIKSYYVHLYSEGTDISNYKIRFGSWGDEDYAVWVPSVDGATLGPW
nr:hypothetical protein [Eubacterium sp.]